MWIRNNLAGAQASAKLHSRIWGIAYIHFFVQSHEYQVSIAQGSGKYVVETYVHGIKYVEQSKIV